MKFSTFATLLTLLLPLAAGLPTAPCDDSTPEPAPAPVPEQPAEPSPAPVPEQPAEPAPEVPATPAEPAPPAPPAPSASEVAAAPGAPSGDAGELAKILIQVAPETESCDGEKFPDECATAEKAAPLIQKSWADFKIENPFEKVGTIALILFESGNFSYSKNHYPEPGNPGQGTRNMQSPKFNKLYAQDVLGDSPELQAAGADVVKVLDLVNTDEHSFGSAAWFLSTQCKPETRTQIQAGTLDGWHAWMADCVGTSNTPGRDAPWNRLKEFIGKGI